jgi:creatinine amidohydrolase
VSVDAGFAARVQVAELTSPQLGAVLRETRPAVLLLPVGAVEPHGPHAPLGTDTIISGAVCERAAAALAGDPDVRVLVLPPIAYGVTRYSAAFPGALGIAEDILESLVTEVCTSARSSGFHSVVIVNSHFEPGHVAALRRAAESDGVGFFDLTRRANAARLTEEFRSGAAHAGSYETSLVLATRPQLVDVETMRGLRAVPVDMPGAIASGKTDFLAMGMDQAYCGAPAEASASEGAGTLVTLTTMLVDLIREQAGV